MSGSNSPVSVSITVPSGASPAMQTLSVTATDGALRHTAAFPFYVADYSDSLSQNTLTRARRHLVSHRHRQRNQWIRRYCVLRLCRDDRSHLQFRASSCESHSKWPWIHNRTDHRELFGSYAESQRAHRTRVLVARLGSSVRHFSRRNRQEADESTWLDYDPALTYGSSGFSIMRRLQQRRWGRRRKWLEHLFHHRDRGGLRHEYDANTRYPQRNRYALKRFGLQK